MPPCPTPAPLAHESSARIANQAPWPVLPRGYRLQARPASNQQLHPINKQAHPPCPIYSISTAEQSRMLETCRHDGVEAAQLTRLQSFPPRLLCCYPDTPVKRRELLPWFWQRRAPRRSPGANSRQGWRIRERGGNGCVGLSSLTIPRTSAPSHELCGPNGISNTSEAVILEPTIAGSSLPT